jgi:hypothetical protein
MNWWRDGCQVQKRTWAKGPSLTWFTVAAALFFWISIHLDCFACPFPFGHHWRYGLLCLDLEAVTIWASRRNTFVGSGWRTTAAAAAPRETRQRRVAGQGSVYNDPYDHLCAHILLVVPHIYAGHGTHVGVAADRVGAAERGAAGGAWVVLRLWRWEECWGGMGEKLGQMLVK